MLSEGDIAKLCYGRIVLIGGVLDSFGNRPVGPHFAIILDSKEEIEENDNMYVVLISTNDQIDKQYVIPVPARTGLIGNVICSWLPPEPVEMAAVVSIHPQVMTDDEMLAIETMIEEYRRSKRFSSS